MTPEIFRDRMLFSELEKVSLKTLKVLDARGLGKYGRNETVQFCGLAIGERNMSAVFLPRQAKVHDPFANLETAKLTMKVLARYGTETPSRLGTGMGKVGAPSLIAAISAIGEDFRRFGLFADRQRHRSRGFGKPDWKRTILQELPLRGAGKNVVYGAFHTTLSRDSRANDLAQIQAHVLNEIVGHHSWWIDGIISRKSELIQVDQPTVDTSGMIRKLRSLRSELYASRPLRLIDYLVSYLEHCAEQPADGILLGVDDFHAVWEHMLRKTYLNVEDGWNSRLPLAQYITVGDKQAYPQERGMQTDIIVRSGNHLTVIDAKYYDAKSVQTSPRWPDIAKQMFYDLSVRTLTNDNETVSGCFVFPSRKNGEGIFGSIQVFDRSNKTALKQFPEIHCIYRSVREVMADYIAGYRRAF